MDHALLLEYRQEQQQKILNTFRELCDRQFMSKLIQYAVLGVTHPLELRSLINWAVWRDPKQRIEEMQESGYDRPNMKRCWELLDATSRSFAAVIKELEGDLCRAVCLFYLVLRGLDTVEDDMTLDLNLKCKLLEEFHEKLSQPGWTFTESELEISALFLAYLFMLLMFTELMMVFVFSQSTRPFLRFATTPCLPFTPISFLDSHVHSSLLSLSSLSLSLFFLLPPTSLPTFSLSYLFYLSSCNYIHNASSLFYTPSSSSTSFNPGGPNEEDRQLLVEFDKVISEVMSLDERYKSVITRICRHMGSGMAHYAREGAQSSSTSYAIDTNADFDLYCHYVAGLVGEGLSSLFSASGKEREDLGQMLSLSNSMGLMLQKTNIMRDFREDLDDGRFFWPREIWGKYTTDPKSFYTHTHLSPQEKAELEQKGLFALSEMILDALAHSIDCLNYLSLLKNQSVFQFCAIPQVMAIATLERCFMNKDVFYKNVKIRKSLAIYVSGLMFLAFIPGPGAVLSTHLLSSSSPPFFHLLLLLRSFLLVPFTFPLCFLSLKNHLACPYASLSFPSHPYALNSLCLKLY